ncbi:glycosyltransferase family 2 protein [Patescibacteria group bacterium]|nr:glycosyltransferase family 2 protein [Patescibacteria group bacterium]
MSEIDVSIIIVHTFEKRKLRQTLRSIRRAAPKLKIEIIVVDNNPPAGMNDILREEFPQVKYIPLEKNKGFGGGMNQGIAVAKGRYILIFNPDIVVLPESLEAMASFMDENPDVGICGPKLLNADKSLQLSCYRQPTLLMPVYRRTPIGKLRFGREAIEDYLMRNVSHEEVMDVDSLIGAALFTRRSDLDSVGLFDERFFLYYEDNDLCRRFWENGKRVVYFPGAQMIHYHRRASADGGLFAQLRNKTTWIQISSFLKYRKKYRKSENPRLEYLKNHGGIQTGITD